MSDIFDKETTDAYYNDGVPLKSECNCCGEVKNVISEFEDRPWHRMGGQDILCPVCFDRYETESCK